MPANRLTDKIDDYAIELGINFDESYTVNVPPTQYGTLAPVAVANWSWTDLNNGIVAESTVGPFPGQGSWRFKSGGGNTAGRIQHGSSSTEQQWAALVRTCNYTYGFWVKVNSLPTNGAVGVIRIQNNTSAGSPSPFYGGLYFGIGQDMDSASPTYQRKQMSFIVQGQTIYNPGWDFSLGQQLELDRWYYIAIRKTKDPVTNTVTFQIYRDGVQVATGANPWYDDLVTFANWGFNNTNQTFAIDINVADVHLAPSSVLDATAIAAIWDAGAPIQVPVKHYDGSNWVDSSDQKIWDGTKWIPMYANMWDGTSWVAI